MTAAPACSQAAAEAALNSITALLNISNSNFGRIKIFTGSPPNSTEDADVGSILSVGMTLSSTAFAAATATSSPYGATAIANTVGNDTSAAGTGTAGYFRAYSYNGTTYVCVVQGNCGTSAADMILNTTAIVAGATVECTSWVINLPSGGATG
jgi:hypothetical protein